ncbi:hypothetical protein ON010_g15344 [Phytophthora cinnamomi]|nr:hypothetical protein ON010_g15344 [Phytophthora cinnamomi]
MEKQAKENQAGISVETQRGGGAPAVVGADVRTRGLTAGVHTEVPEQNTATEFGLVGLAGLWSTRCRSGDLAFVCTVCFGCRRQIDVISRAWTLVLASSESLARVEARGGGTLRFSGPYGEESLLVWRNSLGRRVDAVLSRPWTRTETSLKLSRAPGAVPLQFSAVGTRSSWLGQSSECSLTAHEKIFAAPCAGRSLHVETDEKPTLQDPRYSERCRLSQCSNNAESASIVSRNADAEAQRAPPKSACESYTGAARQQAPRNYTSCSPGRASKAASCSTRPPGAAPPQPGHSPFASLPRTAPFYLAPARRRDHADAHAHAAREHADAQGPASGHQRAQGRHERRPQEAARARVRQDAGGHGRRRGRGLHPAAAGRDQDAAAAGPRRPVQGHDQLRLDHLQAGGRAGALQGAHALRDQHGAQVRAALRLLRLVQGADRRGQGQAHHPHHQLHRRSVGRLHRVGHHRHALRGDQDPHAEGGGRRPLQRTRRLHAPHRAQRRRASTLEGQHPHHGAPGQQPGLQLHGLRVAQPPRVGQAGRRRQDAAHVRHVHQRADRRLARPHVQHAHGRAQDAPHGAGDRARPGAQVQGLLRRHEGHLQGGGRRRALEGPAAAAHEDGARPGHHLVRRHARDLHLREPGAGDRREQDQNVDATCADGRGSSGRVAIEGERPRLVPELSSSRTRRD